MEGKSNYTRIRTRVKKAELGKGSPCLSFIIGNLNLSIAFLVEPAFDHPTSIAAFHYFGFICRNKQIFNQLPVLSMIITFKKMKSKIEVAQGMK